MFEIIPKGFYFDFVARRHLFANLSWAAWGISLLLFFVIGPNWSIDFTGGTEVQVAFQQTTNISEVRESLKALGVSDDAIQQVGDGGDNRFLFRTQGESSADPADVAAVKDALISAYGADFIEEFREDKEVGTRVSVQYKGQTRGLDDMQAALKSVAGVSVQGSPEDNTFYVRLPGLAEQVRGELTDDLGERGVVIERTETVGPKVGSNLRTAGIVSVGVTMLLLLIYVGFRFDFTFAPGAIICLLHDSVILIGIWVVTHQEFGLSMISALLTLLGYSINDTIVVYDRIRENMERYRSTDFGKLINDSINQTLSRTIITSGATALSMVPFLIWGGPVLFQFAEAMLIGIVIGTYSSVYVAAPLTIVLQENRSFFARIFGQGPSKSGPPAKA